MIMPGRRGGRVWSVSRRPGASLRFNTGPPPHVEEVSTGHALELGMTEAIRRYVAICYPNA